MPRLSSLDRDVLSDLRVQPSLEVQFEEIRFEAVRSETIQTASSDQGSPVCAWRVSYQSWPVRSELGRPLEEVQPEAGMFSLRLAVR